MKKLFVLFLMLILTSPASLAWGPFGKKTKSVEPAQNSGYNGQLPVKFDAPNFKETKPVFEETKEFNSANEVKPIPRDNPAFVNIILKSDKTSPYLNDINEIIPILEKIYDSIENKENVQRFVAKAYFFNKNIDYLRDKYTGKPESSYVSFKKLQELSLHTQTVSTLRSEAEKYNPYLAYTGAGYIYDPNNIDKQLEYLQAEVEQVIIILKEAN